MFRQIIHPENKNELVIHLPEEFIGKEVEVNVNEVKKKRKKKTLRSPKKKLTGKARAKAIERLFAWGGKHGVDMSNFKFDREEANAR